MGGIEVEDKRLGSKTKSHKQGFPLKKASAQGSNSKSRSSRGGPIIREDDDENESRMSREP